MSSLDGMEVSGAFCGFSLDSSDTFQVINWCTGCCLIARAETLSSVCLWEGPDLDGTRRADLWLWHFESGDTPLGWLLCCLYVLQCLCVSFLVAQHLLAVSPCSSLCLTARCASTPPADWWALVRRVWKSIKHCDSVCKHLDETKTHC